MVNEPRPRGRGPFRTEYASTRVTAPEPTVRPPSRMAKRSPSSSAAGVSAGSSTVTDAASPGMHISMPSGSVTVPVTSAVRKKNCGL